MGDQAPLVERLSADLDATAKGSDATISVGAAPFDGVVTSVTYTPVSKITGADTNTRILKLINKGAKGEGTTIVAELELKNGVNANALDETALTLGEAKKLVVAAGDVLAFSSLHGGEGLADVGGEVTVKVSRS
jgi:hypothetical protein